ncbi:hypothetical protein HRbin34_00024 [bacterium HR34]|nr:hypothetical protein HRbin34_00024 [bacterium HR34]
MFHSFNYLKNEKGYTLVEVLSALAVASIVVTTAMSLFINAFSTQVKVVQRNDIILELNYLINYMSRNLRMAQYDESGECGKVDSNYNQVKNSMVNTENQIYFKNQEGNCQGFYLDNGVIYQEIDQGDTTEILRLTSELIYVKTFKVVDPISSWERGDGKQPRVTFIIEAYHISDPDKKTIKLQTTVSQASIDAE